MTIKWNSVEIKGNAYGLYLEGTFDDDNSGDSNGTYVIFTAPLYGTDIEMDVHELIDGELGDVITKDITNDKRDLYTKQINNCRANLRDELSYSLGKYEN